MTRITKLPLLLLLVVGVLILLSACEEPQEPLPETESVELEIVGKVKQGMSHYDMVQDRKTGCLYISRSESYSPYYDESGKVKGCKGTGL